MHYIMGIVFVILPVVCFLYERHIILNEIETDATVIRIEKVRGRGWKSYYQAVLSYKVDEKEYEVDDPSAINLPLQTVGDVVRIIYHKENPEKIIAKSISRTVVYIIFAIIFLVGVFSIINSFL